ncbi:putative Bacterial DNA polymerase III, alpha subunit [Vibrio nigripulchritudo SO65]|uniref:error-prone DNA polymerase n=1 Tax=Vibrio nigripulchritudo TaxID=28173 RepID=UPI0003B23E17|nr:error-prone DNA polymerase [Vibrio nigripulchritudo]CCN36885.1 putative Bacterial DNA polymerase III, alpha subunit [Vibrio nigripulchritudo AM115]CCN42554.1 putative Bacterial DNA polymerase III, alpha subunit [Vibrio nigripulchritudo FTn2]CCN63862.1 putative Bacterial DNA polymerase III, alpha subunit [Vibrio nigripulchritudo POn4]CCN74735.1 putative Bacterial DNA polymerase III, alpha subunit [Vibrio nigripulchritudo SO65]
MKYAELFCQTNFSFLEGASSPEELVTQADFLQYSAIAITDECSVAGVVRAHTAARDQELKVKLIVGSLFRMNEEVELILLAPDRQAYGELCRIITNARRRSAKGEYSLSEWDIMSAKNCLVIWLPKHQRSDFEWAKWLIKHHNNRLWIGLQRHLQHNDHRFIEHSECLSRLYQLPITACGGVLMHTAERLPLQHTLTAIKHGTTVAKAGKFLQSNCEHSLRSKEKLLRVFKSEWLEESHRIQLRCSFDMGSLRYEYPSELVPNGYTPMSYLREQVRAGSLRRFPSGVPEHVQNLIDKELSLIEELEYPYYFLTIYDIVMFAKRNHILYQGRGSAANSVVCYCLEITAVDPRQISVLFERFISKERNEPPDIDVDFEHERREEVIQYIYQKYGRQRAALSATVITYRFKSAVREVGKALGISETQLDFFIKNVNRRDRSLGWQAQIVELGLEPESHQGQLFIKLVSEIMGFPRHLSQHVGGFVISSGPLHELVPVENAAMDDRTVIQWDKDDLESLGLMKVDVLALGMLTAIRKCFDTIKTFHNIELSIADITRKQDDPNVYGMIQKADTIGVFQIESRAQMSMLPRLKPKNYYDLVIQIAIVRPGPIQGDMVHPFLKRRNGIEEITYPSEEVKDVLSRTMGVPIFQEQVIKLAMVAAGFSGGEADQLRRAMASWKKNGQLMKFKSKLINGMLERGYEEGFAIRIFDQICGFGEYGFPESHSASFAVLAYVSAWLKHYYPEAFFTALMNSHPMGFYSISQLVQDARRHGISVQPICVNQSDYDHLVVKRDKRFHIRLGMRIIKGLKKETAEKIAASRSQSGYRNVSDLKNVGIERKDLETLASADALKAFVGNRFSARWNIMDDDNDLPLLQSLDTSSQPYHYQPDDFSNLTEDYAATGLSLNKHPITLLNEAGLLPRFSRMSQLPDKQHKSLITVIGVVTGRQSPGTAGGVTFFTLEDDTGNINVVVWGATARAQKQAYLTAKVLKVKGVLEREGEVIHVIAGKLTDMTDSLADLRTHSRDFH